MPSANRRRFLPHAIDYWQRQDYPHRELLIVGDSRDAIADLLPDDPRITYIEAPRAASIGSRRNIACEHARGQLIAHWDDDDWYSPTRLSRQVRALEDGAALCGVAAMFYYDSVSGRAFRYDHPPSGPTWLSALCYQRSHWLAHRFPDQSIGEDARFLRACARSHYCVLHDPALQVCILHGTNVAPKNTRGRAWQSVPASVIQNSLATDFWRYAPGSMPEHTRITVAIPYHRCAEHIRQAVESVLAQTHRALRVIVVNDGDDTTPPWPALAHLDDPRLIRFDLAHNRGRYYADAVVLGATNDMYMCLHDADDWSEPDRIARLLSAPRAG